MTAKPSNVVDLPRAPARGESITEAVMALPSDHLLVLSSADEIEAARTLGLEGAVVPAPTDGSIETVAAWVAQNVPNTIKRIYLCLPNDESWQTRAKALVQATGSMMCRRVRLSHGFTSIAEVVENGLSKSEVTAALRNAKHCDPLLEQIEAIDRSDPFAATQLKATVIPQLKGMDAATVEDFMAILQKRFGLKHKAIKALRAELEPTPDDHEDSGPDEYQMTAEEEEEALELLRDPKLLEIIERELTEALGICGERHVKLALYLTMVSRISATPICCTLLAGSSEGKTYATDQVSKAFDSSQIVRLSSASTRSLEYSGGGMLDGKVIIIGEWDALGDPVLESIVRQAMSERRVSRLSTQWHDNVPKVTLNEASFRAAWIVTSTTETQDFNQENLNRGWTLYVSSDPSQTKRVLEFQKKAQTLGWKKAGPERDLRILRLQNTNRLLKNYEVVIPFAELIDFPAATARARRDLSRFMQTVALCTLMHQYQREAKQEGELTYLEATLDDYRAAFEIMAPIIAGTLSDLSERSKRVLRVAVHLRDSTAGEDKSAADVDFGVRDLQAHADEMNLDLRNSQDLRRVLKVLTAQEYIIITEGAEQRGGGKAKRYALASSSLSLNEDGDLVGLADALMGITTPEELRQAVEAAHV